MSSKPETIFRKFVTAFLKELPNTFQMSIQQKSIVGSPDKIVCINGKFVAIEIKSLGGKVSPAQGLLLDDVEKSNGVSLVVSPANWDEVQRILAALAIPGALGKPQTWREIYDDKASNNKVRKRKKQPSIRTGNGQADEYTDGY